MQKQKVIGMIDDGIKPTKIRKITGQNCSQSQSQSNVRIHNVQSTSQGTNFTQVIDDPPVKQNLDRLMEIWNHARQHQTFLFNDNQRDQFVELKQQLAQAAQKIKKLRNSFCEIEESNESMTKYIENEVTVQNEIIEKQNISLYLMSVVVQHTDAVTDTLRQYEENREDLMKLYRTVKLKQQELLSNLTELCNNNVSKEQKELTEQLQLKNNELLSAQTKYQQYENEIMQITQKISEINGILEEGKKIISENRIKYDDDIIKSSNTLKNIEKNFKAVLEENSKLSMENGEILKKSEELLLEQKVLLVTALDYEDQIKYLKSNFLELKEEEAILVNELDELNAHHFASVSSKVLELADYTKQLEDLRLLHTEITNKFNEELSNNEEFSKTVNKKLEEVEQLKNALQNKDDETTSLDTDLLDALEKQKELSTNIQSLNEELITQGKQINRTKVDSEILIVEESEHLKKISEMKTRLTTMKQTLQCKCYDENKLLEKIGKEKIEYASEMKKFEQDIEQKAKHINELEEIKEYLIRKESNKESEFNSRFEKIMHSLNDCLLTTEHEKQIQKHNVNIEILTKDLSAVKLKTEQENLKKLNLDKQKVIHEAALKDMESQFADLKKKYFQIKRKNEKLHKKWKNVQISRAAESARQFQSTSCSQILSAAYAKNESTPTSSTPNSTSRVHQRIRFDLGSSMDLSSISGSRINEEESHRYTVFAQSNKTDASKLIETNETEKLQMSPEFTTTQLQTRYGKVFKRYGQANQSAKN